MTHLSTAVQNYHAFPNTTVSQFSTASSVSIIVSMKGVTTALESLANAPLDFLSNPIFQKLSNFDSITAVYFFRNYVRPGSTPEEPFMYATLDWLVYADYNFGFGAGRVSFDISFENTIVETTSRTIIILIAMTITASCLSFLLTIKALLRSFAAFKFAKENLEGCMTLPWESLSFSDKFAFFNLWLAIILLYCVLVHA